MRLFLLDFQHLHDSLNTYAQKPQFQLTFAVALESEPELNLVTDVAEVKKDCPDGDIVGLKNDLGIP